VELLTQLVSFERL